ncbi:hypothetical protein IAE35_10755 [Pseudomonas sp. S75]|uniref:hypothetical protein n=1 Tax=unclassified Pseudomonas TaxID=196821 RepID=UPI0019064084|nr:MULTISPECIES: hypothetical protein [unclassified Pseudomonas]MBJ9976908.1 hypothetical protein [Pseudomonas sp. S30]MBK0153817.1 hypothetical protein [Pseudomonas sp. S75]
MVKKPLASVPALSSKPTRGAAQLNATLARINAALEMLQKGPKRFKNISQLAEEIARICGIDRSLLLKRQKSYRKCLERVPELYSDGGTPSTPYNVEIDPRHTVMIRNKQLEEENAKLRNIVDDLSNRATRLPQAQETSVKASVPEYQREYEVTCQLVDRILDHQRVIRIDDDTLIDFSDVSGIPRPIADSALIAPYVKWKNSRA